MSDPTTRPALVLLAADLAATRQQAELPAWTVAGGCLSRRIDTSGWKATLMVVNTIGHLAEAAWHHPELVVAYASVTVSLSTHEAGGLTERDFALAAKIESVVMWRPGTEPGAVLEGTPDDPRYRYLQYR